MGLTWKHYKGVYTGTTPLIDSYYAVSRRENRRWECWIAGEYLGSFPTMRAAKAEAEIHNTRVHDVEEAHGMALVEHMERGYSLLTTLRTVYVSQPTEPENLPYEPENLPHEPDFPRLFLGVCQWFLLCINQATGTAEDHKGENVPICDRCRKLAGK